MLTTIRLPIETAFIAMFGSDDATTSKSQTGSRGTETDPYHRVAQVREHDGRLSASHAGGELLGRVAAARRRLAIYREDSVPSLQTCAVRARALGDGLELEGVGVAERSRCLQIEIVERRAIDDRDAEAGCDGVGTERGGGLEQRIADVVEAALVVDHPLDDELLFLESLGLHLFSRDAADLRHRRRASHEGERKEPRQQPGALHRRGHP